MNQLRVTLVQSDIFWEDKTANLEHFRKLLEKAELNTDLIVLPEMFSTGFSMQCNHLSETNKGNTMTQVKEWSTAFNCAIAGSFLARDEDNQTYNRGFFITPEKNSYFYDKRHLFRIGNENELFTKGNKQMIINYKGWNINLIICYDLRFPVWSRNVNNAYDLLICTANWPEVRSKVWNILLKARAIENMAYVCGVNRVGKDNNGFNHIGNSSLISPKGDILTTCQDNETKLVTYAIEKDKLNDFREKFPAWKDADLFSIIP